MNNKTPYNIKSISEYHQILGIEKPKHPLISLFDHEDIRSYSDERLKTKTYNFYTISLKRGYTGKMKYGAHYYDFDEGVMVFHGPRQAITSELADNMHLTGWTLLIHPDFIQPYPLAIKFREYGFFSYAMNEALHPSDEESGTIEDVITTIRREYNSGIDRFSQDILVSQIELLLNYCNRFYHRQFLTRKKVNNDLLIQLEQILNSYFNNEDAAAKGIPSVQYIADELHVSPAYLSDMLRTITGRSAQQHITDQIIEKGKELLTTTSLSVSEIAYRLGYENPQSFHKLFKNRTQLTPLKFRASFN